MPGKHNAGGCGCCGTTYPCWFGCPHPTQLILTGFTSGNPCNPLSHSGTYALNFNLGFCNWRFYGVGDELYVEDCGPDYDSIILSFLLTIQHPSTGFDYSIYFDVFAQGNNYAGSGDDRLEQYSYELILPSSDPCPSGTVTIPFSVAGAGVVGVPLGVNHPSSVEVVFP